MTPEFRRWVETGEGRRWKDPRSEPRRPSVVPVEFVADPPADVVRLHGERQRRQLAMLANRIREAGDDRDA